MSCYTCVDIAVSHEKSISENSLNSVIEYVYEFVHVRVANNWMYTLLMKTKYFDNITSN